LELKLVPVLKVLKKTREKVQKNNCKITAPPTGAVPQVINSALNAKKHF